MAVPLKNLLWPKPPHPLARRGLSSPRSSPNPRHSGLNFGGAGILNLLSIVYAHRPRLRTRLTLGGRTFPRKPWVYGESEFNGLYRYSCLHSHFQALQFQSPSTFDALGTLPYHSSRTNAERIHSFGMTFDRQSFSARDRSMSQLLRTV